jgi:hypothetical protein
MAIQKEHQMMAGHLLPKNMDKSQLDEMLNSIKQPDRPPDNRNMKIISRD